MPATRKDVRPGYSRRGGVLGSGDKNQRRHSRFHRTRVSWDSPVGRALLLGARSKEGTRSSDSFRWFELGQIRIGGTRIRLRSRVVWYSRGGLDINRAREYERVFREAAPAKRAQQKLEREFAARNAELAKLEKQGRDLQTELERENVTMPESARREKERQLADISRTFQRIQREIREDLNLRRNEELASVQERATRVINQIAEQEKFDLSWSVFASGDRHHRQVIGRWRIISGLGPPHSPGNREPRRWAVGEPRARSPGRPLVPPAPRSRSPTRIPRRSPTRRGSLIVGRGDLAPRFRASSRQPLCVLPDRGALHPSGARALSRRSPERRRPNVDAAPRSAPSSCGPRSPRPGHASRNAVSERRHDRKDTRLPRA